MKFTCSLFFAFFISAAAYAQSGGFTLHEGNLDGAPYKIAIPDQWNTGRVFIHVHGWRPDDAPHEANLDPEDPFYRYLISSGWIIGRTAFQKNGVDHKAHIGELNKLRQRINELAGSVDLLILEGESTAGTLVLKIAEEQHDLADGVIALSPFIELDDPKSEDFLNATPQIPSVLMSNLTEMDGPLMYAASAATGKEDISLRPLERPGHVNINWVERKDALLSLLNHIRGTSFSAIIDGTRAVPARITNTKTVNGRLENQVSSIDPFFGNIIAGFHPDELTNSGIEQGTVFVFEYNGLQQEIYYGTAYGDVERGEWIAFPAADDRLLIARNHEHAASTIQIQTGDTISIRPLK